MKTFVPLSLTAITLGFVVSTVATPTQSPLASTRLETEQQFSRVYQPPVRGERSGQQGTRFDARPDALIEQI